MAVSMRAAGSHSAVSTHLHNAVPSLSASSRSPGGSRSPSMSSIQLRASLAAWGVYLPRRSFFMSWSSDVTDAMAEGRWALSGQSRAASWVVDAGGYAVLW